MADETTREGRTLAGTILRGADGALYFVRDEVLEACKISEKDMHEFCDKVLRQEERAQESGFQLSAGSVKNAVTVQGQFNAGNFKSVAASTVMCPGVMKDSAVFPVYPKLQQLKKKSEG